MPRKAKRDREGNPFEKGENAPNLEKLAIECIDAFFGDKSWFCGGPIPQRELLADSSVKTVLRTQHDARCFDFIHNECLPRIPNTEGWDNVSVPWTVRCLLLLIHDLEIFGIPPEFRPGILLLYFKFCKGVKIPPPPLL